MMKYSMITSNLLLLLRRVSRAGDKVAGLRQAQLQRDGEGHRRGLGGLVVRVVADLREQLAIHIGLLVDLSVLFFRCGR